MESSQGKEALLRGFPLLDVLSQYSPHAVGLVVSAAVVTYVLFQLKMLPRSVSRVASRVFFYPTFPITAMMRWGNYWCSVDETVCTAISMLICLSLISYHIILHLCCTFSYSGDFRLCSNGIPWTSLSVA